MIKHGLIYDAIRKVAQLFPGTVRSLAHIIQAALMVLSTEEREADEVCRPG